MPELKAPAAKLPLAVRKNVRDELENKKTDFESQLTNILGVPWTIDINPLEIWPYAEENSYAANSLGSCIAAYVNGAIWQLKNFTGKHGDGGKDELNSVCAAHVLTLTASTKVNYCGCDIESGHLRLLFGPTYLGTNIDDATANLAKVVSAADQPKGAPSLSYVARHAVKTDYDPQIGALLERASKELENPDLKFEPGFDDLGKMLKGGKDVRDDWEANLGSFALAYFASFVERLEREKFGEDDMLREGFAEAVPKGVVRLRIAEKIKGSYSEILLDDGELVLQTVPTYWGTNIGDVASNLVNIL